MEVLELPETVPLLKSTHTYTADGKESAGNAGDTGSSPGSGRFPGKGTGYPFQYPCLMGGRPPNSDYDLSGVSLALASALKLFSVHLFITGLEGEIHFSLHVTIQSRNGSLLLCRIKEDDTSK